MVLGALFGFSPVAAQSPYDVAIGRALRLLPRQPEKIMLVERADGSHLHTGRPRTEAFVNRGGTEVFLVRQGVTLKAALKGPGIFDYALATVIWHEMAHIAGADEGSAGGRAAVEGVHAHASRGEQHRLAVSGVVTEASLMRSYKLKLIGKNAGGS